MQRSPASWRTAPPVRSSWWALSSPLNLPPRSLLPASTLQLSSSSTSSMSKWPSGSLIWVSENHILISHKKSIFKIYSIELVLHVKYISSAGKSQIYSVINGFIYVFVWLVPGCVVGLWSSQHKMLCHLFSDKDHWLHSDPSYICSSVQLSSWTSSIYNSQRSPRPIWSMRTSWPWRCLCSSLWTTTLPASMWPSLKGSLWVIRETTVICLESGPLWEMKRWDSLKYHYSRGPNVLQVKLKISSDNMHFNI